MRKSTYMPLGPQERFIVPLLRGEIEALLAELSLKLSRNSKSLSSRLRALDCGCGNQPFKRIIEQHGFEYDSLDISQNKYNNIDYIVSLDSSIDTFDSIVTKTYPLVIATEVLEHVSDWYLAFTNLASCIEPGGYALLTAPFFYPLHEEPHDYCRPTIYQFEKVSSFSGLEVYSTKKIGTSADVIGTILGAGRIRYSQPTGILTKVANRLLHKFQEYTFKFLCDHRKHLESSCASIYLSNVVVLKKPSIS